MVALCWRLANAEAARYSSPVAANNFQCCFDQDEQKTLLEHPSGLVQARKTAMSLKNAAEQGQEKSHLLSNQRGCGSLFI